MRMPWCTTVVLLSLGAPPHLAGQQRAARPTVRDSVGVTIVSWDSAAAPQRFELRPTALKIVAAAGSELVRIVSAIRMPDGRIITADAGRRELLRFASNGALERILGRDGRGPGEFLILRWMGRHGRDSIATYDGRQFRYSVFSDGGFVRQAVLQKSEHLYQAEMNVIGLRPDGGPVVTRGGAIALRAEGPARVERQPFPIVSYSADGRSGKVLAHVPGTEIEVTTISAGPLAGGFQRGLRLLGADAAFGLSNGYVIAVDNAHFQFDVIDTSGRLIRRVRRDGGHAALLVPHVAT